MSEYQSLTWRQAEIVHTQICDRANVGGSFGFRRLPKLFCVVCQNYFVSSAKTILCFQTTTGFSLLCVNNLLHFHQHVNRCGRQLPFWYNRCGRQLPFRYNMATLALGLSSDTQQPSTQQQFLSSECATNSVGGLQIIAVPIRL